MGPFDPLAVLPFASVFMRALSFDGFAAFTLRAALAPLGFEAGAFALRAGACVFLTGVFAALFFTTFFAALLTDLAVFLAGFFAGAIGKYLFRELVIASMRVRCGAR